MQMSAVFEDGGHAFGHLAGLHLVIANGFAVDGEVEDGAELFDVDVGGGRMGGQKGGEEKGWLHDDGTKRCITNSQALRAFLLSPRHSA